MLSSIADSDQAEFIQADPIELKRYFRYSGRWTRQELEHVIFAKHAATVTSPTQRRHAAMRIIEETWDLFEKLKIPEISRHFSVEPKQIQDALETLKTINPKPGYHTTPINRQLLFRI
jgi:hypothetical protein